MNTYENAPATKLLATNCACCGRALVDAVSVETGIGPECRKNFSVDVVVDEAARNEANVLVHAVAKKGVKKAECRAICAKLDALGFVVLAARIMKRFRMTLAPAAVVDVDALRAEYKAILADMTYDNATASEFNALVKDAGAHDAESYVAIAKSTTCTCKRCAGTGRYVVGTENGSPKFGGGECFRCGGKGRQDRDDAKRNRYYDQHAMNRAARAMFAA